MGADEEVIEYGRAFKLHIRQTDEHDGRRYWVASVTVVGKEGTRGGSWSVGPCLSEEELRDQLRASMLKYRS